MLADRTSIITRRLHRIYKAVIENAIRSSPLFPRIRSPTCLSQVPRQLEEVFSARKPSVSMGPMSTLYLRLHHLPLSRDCSCAGRAGLEQNNVNGSSVHYCEPWNYRRVVKKMVCRKVWCRKNRRKVEDGTICVLNRSSFTSFRSTEQLLKPDRISRLVVKQNK